MASRTAKKTTKKVNTKANTVDFTESFNKIKDTAININKEVLDTAGDVVEDLRNNGEQIREVAVKRVKATFTKVNETITMDNIMDTAKNVNKYTLKTAEELVDGALSNGEKIQGITAKAVKGGLKLAAKQQDIVFDALETVKGQLTGSAVRFRKLFSKN